jgi:hypothetical protein
MPEFTFSYMTSKNHVNIDEKSLHIKIGPFVKKEIALSNILYFYVKDYKEYREFIIHHTKANGKSSNLKLLGSYGSQDIDNLANFLAASYPTKDLRKMDSKEALKLMKAVNSQKMALWIVAFLIPAVMTIFFLPGLIHYFDSGHENAKIEDIISGKNFPTHNLTITGVVLNEGMWEKTTTTNKGNTTTTEKNYFPLISETWKEGEPLHVILESSEMTQAETDEFVLKTSFNGTMRNVLWEGVAKDQREFFKSEYGLTMADNIVLFEVTDEKPDEYIPYVYGVVLLVELIIFFIVWLKYRKNN